MRIYTNNSKVRIGEFLQLSFVGESESVDADLDSFYRLCLFFVLLRFKTDG